MGVDSLRCPGARRRGEKSDREPPADRPGHVRDSWRSLRDPCRTGCARPGTILLRMTFEDALRLVDYHYWARDRMLAALAPLPAGHYIKNLGNSFPSIRDTVVHTYGAEWVWYSRWIGDSPASLPNPEDFPALYAIRDPCK